MVSTSHGGADQQWRQRTGLAVIWQQPDQNQLVAPEWHLSGESYGVHSCVVKRGATCTPSPHHLGRQPRPPPLSPLPDLPLVGEGRIHLQPACACWGTSVSIRSGRLWWRFVCLGSNDIGLSTSESRPLLSEQCTGRESGRPSGAHPVV